MSLALVSGALALALAMTGAWQIFGVSTRRSELAVRLQAVARTDSTSRWLLATEDRLARVRLVRRLGRRLEAGGFGLSATHFLLRCGAGLLLLFAVMSVVGSTVLAGIITLIGVGGIKLWLDRRAEQRREEFVAQLPDLARLLSNSANAGLALQSGIELAAREVPEPAGSELRQVTDAMAVGIPVEDALGDLSRRLPSKEVSVLVTTLVVQQRAGGRIITALRNVADTLEARKEVRREIRTVMSGAMASITLVTIIGVGSLVLVNVINPTIFDQMLASNVGRIVLALSGTLYVIGFAIVRRMTRIDI